jgi:hypothetical protein
MRDFCLVFCGGLASLAISLAAILGLIELGYLIHAWFGTLGVAIYIVTLFWAGIAWMISSGNGQSSMG